MFAKSFKLIFGIGAGVIATGALLAAVIGLGVLIWEWTGHGKREEESRRVDAVNFAFHRLCEDASNPFYQYLDSADARSKLTQLASACEDLNLRFREDRLRRAVQAAKSGN